jgi:hypothetical protein
LVERPKPGEMSAFIKGKESCSRAHARYVRF